MKHFVTIYPQAENVHLVKDIGQIPYQLQKHCDYRSTLVCWKNSPRYPYLQKEVKGLNIEFIKNKGRTFFWSNSALRYIWKNASSIDVLNLYFLVQESMLYGLIYKLRNPNGVIYLKLDMDVNYYEKHMITFSDIAWKEKIHQQMYEYFLGKVDIISAESDRALSVLEKLDSRLSPKTIKIPNGLDFTIGRAEKNKNLYAQKENIILTVGRIGSESKNNEFLLRVLEKIDLTNWKIFLVGPITEDFESSITAFFERNPTLKDQVFFIGNIEDRDELMTYYAKAKIFCLTSRWEAFPLVLLEALSKGNYIIGTDRISSIEAMTCNGKIGRIVELDNTDQLAGALNEVMNPDFYSKDLMNRILNHGHKFDWEKIVEKLDKEIRKKL